MCQSVLRTPLLLTLLLFILIGPPLLAQPEDEPLSEDDIISLLDRLWTLRPVEPYVPECNIEKSPCKEWTAFRNARPYPFQGLSAIPLANDHLGIFISEPSPYLSKDEWIDLTRVLFGDDLIKIDQFRWKIGIDGWVEDLVVEIKTPKSLNPHENPADFNRLIDDPLFRDRIGLLNVAMYGTTFGAELYTGRHPTAKTDFSVPNLNASPSEINAWVTSSENQWRSLLNEENETFNWEAVLNIKETKALIATDGSLVLLTFHIDDLRQLTPWTPAFEQFRTAFRQFTVASDIILGGLWTNREKVALVARARTIPADVLPPLRFETFHLLSAQRRNELHQSYERNHILAGKMGQGPYRFKDWAPIYLSQPLIDTEFGALLNITDQMLKSWSQAGQVKYLYFDYPMAPETFAFEDKPLSQLVYETSGGKSILFNWNTSGSAVIVDYPGRHVLAAGRTGALAVTYGSDLKAGGEAEIGHLTQYEDKAYNYFSNLGDPNLSRVVQYTLIYQIFRALDQNRGNSYVASASDHEIKARKASTQFLISETQKYLTAIEDAEEDSELQQAALEALNAFRQKHPKVGDDELARLLADPRTESLKIQAQEVALFSKRQEVREQYLELTSLSKEIEEQVSDYEAMIDSYNRRVDRLQNSSDNVTLEQIGELRHQKSEIDRLESVLRRKEERLKKLESSLLQKAQLITAHNQRLDVLNDANTLRLKLAPINNVFYNLDEVRQGYIEHNNTEPPGWIKTPSVVLSWASLLSTGGHNLNSRALRFERSLQAKGIELIEKADGLVLRYPPHLEHQVGNRANAIARAVEHLRITDPARIGKLASEPVSIRPKPAVLQIAKNGSAEPLENRLVQWRGQYAMARYEGINPDAIQVRQLAEVNNCCLYLSSGRNGSFVAKHNPSPPPTAVVIEFRSIPPLNDFLATEARLNHRKPIVAIGKNADGHANALIRGLDPYASTPQSLKRLAELFGKKRNQQIPELELSVRHLDMDGEPSFRQLLNPTPETIQSGPRLLQATPQWAGSKVRPLNTREMQEWLPKDWPQTKDGMTTAVLIDFGPSEPVVKEVTILSRFRDLVTDQTRQQLLDIQRETILRAQQENPSVASMFATLTKQLKKKSPHQIARIEMIIKGGGKPAYFSQHDAVSQWKAS